MLETKPYVITEPKTKKHYKLNAKQIHMLKIVYKFRFINAPLMARYKGLNSRKAVYESLQVLYRQNYLDKKIAKNETFDNRGARYFLTLDGMKLLSTDPNLKKPALHLTYANPKIGYKFIDHSVDIMRAFLSLKDSYGDIYDIFTKTELTGYQYFLSPPSDLYLNRMEPDTDQHNEYLLDILADEQPYLIRKRIDAYIQHFDDEEWITTARKVYPAIRIVCKDSKVEDDIQKYVVKRLEDEGMDEELFFYTTTIKAILASDKTRNNIWSNVSKPEELLSLS